MSFQPETDATEPFDLDTGVFIGVEAALLDAQATNLPKVAEPTDTIAQLMRAHVAAGLDDTRLDM